MSKSPSLLRRAIYWSVFFLTGLVLSNPMAGQVNLTQGLVAYYPMNGNANDASGNGNHAADINATLSSDRAGIANSAYRFNGIDNFIRIPNRPTLNTTDKISLSVWVRVNGFYTGACHGNSILAKGDADYKVGNYFLRFDDAYYSNFQHCGPPVANNTRQTFYGINSAPLADPPYIQPGTWYNVIYTSDGTTAKTYVNCRLVNTGASNGITFTNTDDLYLGRLNSSAFPYWLNGDLDEVRIYNRVLNEDEVKALGECGIIPSQPPCEQTLRLPGASMVRVGDLDVIGNQLTIEATFNSTAPPVSGTHGFLVSKHTGPLNCNYFLSPDGCAITTSGGYRPLSDPCPIELNRNYHVAMVYDGVALKFYRNGELKAQTPASGNLTLNNLITTIGQNVPEGAGTVNSFTGYLDEVRIWNAARTQQQIRDNMDKTLLNPVSQTGLLAYYTFENLQNKQSNTAWNGTAFGGAVPNEANNKCDITPEGCSPPSFCDKTLQLPSLGSKVTIGDLDITGDKLTVEAVFNRTAPLNSGLYYGHLVSKHTNTANVNYALLPNGCEITTTGSGYTSTFQDCPLTLGKTYHVAMVYDGALLKFYRNGVLISQKPCTGNVITNDFLTTIGQVARGDDPVDNQFLGFVNEVRIWKAARTNAQILANMNQLLPNPTSQVGLVGYYSFSSLQNRQGNTSFNGTLAGSAAIAKPNPDCSFGVTNCPTEIEVHPDFTIPDTVCVNMPVNISNTSTNATNYFWSFCAAGGDKAPEAANIGNPGNMLVDPVFMDYVFSNGRYYGYVVSHIRGEVVRLDFGNSLLNTPTPRNFGNFNGVLPIYAEGIQVVQNQGRWYAIVVGGSVQNGVLPYIVKIDLGTDLSNNNPVATNWGNIGNMDQPIDLHVFQENGNWFGLTVSAENNTITRFNFSSSFNNTPTAVNFGNIGGLLNYPTGIHAMKQNGNWHVFVTNAQGNASIVRLDFGNSLLNSPVAVNLGNPGNVLSMTRDIYIMKGCDQFVGYAVVYGDELVKIDFGNDLLSVPVLTSLGNRGNMDFPHSISKLFRVGNDLYTFITNNDNNTITRLRFEGCEDAVIPSSNLQNPPPVKYAATGTYNISLTVDEGLPTQSTICKQVVVLPELVHQPTKSIRICVGEGIKIGSSSSTGSYTWNTGAVSDSIFVNASGIYWVETNRYGCTKRDSFNVVVDTRPALELGNDTLVCALNDLTLDSRIIGATYLWSNGSTSRSIQINTPGKYFVTVKQNACEVSDTITITLKAGGTSDFNYTQQVCDPLRLTFQGNGNAVADTYWSFGDGRIQQGGNPVNHTYAAMGSYTVKYSAGGPCPDTITKLIPVNVTQDNIVYTADTTICAGTAITLRTNAFNSFCWTPHAFLDNPSSLNPTVIPQNDMIYEFKAEVTGSNLVVNGDFSQGNTGFVSGYQFTPNNTGEGQYFVGPNPRDWRSSLGNCKDHSTGTGNMLMVKARTSKDTIWSQTISVSPNTNYAFSAWIQALNSPNPANLHFYINGREASSYFMTVLPVCNWDRYKVNWNSGSNTTIDLLITSENTSPEEDFFALDDISFAPVFLKKDSVNILIERAVVRTGNDTIVCPGSPVPLSVTGAQSYTWTPATGLSDVTISNPVASTPVSIQYIVTGKSSRGCLARDTVQINMFPRPIIIMVGDTAICNNGSAQLAVTGGVQYQWSPSVSLSNPDIANPVAKPTANTRYYVDITDINSCQSRDSVDVSIRPLPQFTVSPAVQACPKDSVQMYASGGDRYEWQPALGLNKANVPNPMAAPASTTTYAVTITDAICNISSTLTTGITVLPAPVILASRSNDIDCANDRSQLNASGAVEYAWSPALTLSNAAIANPVARPVSTTSYIVTGKDGSGCIGYDTVMVKVDYVNKGGYELPNAFTPNHDGLNDCFGFKYWGIVTELEFSIYNRWGERIFFTSNPAQCWDGTYQGKEQDGGVYVYMIKAKTTCQPEVFKKGTVVLVR
jgi:gliding motility-associated-like protein